MRPCSTPRRWLRTRLSNWQSEISRRYAAAAGLGAVVTTQGHDAVHASGVGLARSTDAEILIRAKQEARTVVTADLDYPRLLALAGAEGPSLILFRGGDWSEHDVTARIQQILHVMGESELAQSIVVVDRSRVRRRRLPIT